MICCSAKVSLFSFSFTILLFISVFSCPEVNSLLTQIPAGTIVGPGLIFILINILLKLIYSKDAYQIAVRAVLLAFVFISGVFIRLYGAPHLQIFGTYMSVMATFHYTEFLSIAIIQPALVSTDSYVINHSKEYTIAAVTSWIEYFIECYLFPGLKTIPWLSSVGLTICICGELLRKCAMFTAKSNFNHIVQCEKSENHVLVTHGVYSFCRHPSYVGWFYWSIGTQVTLLNPFCTLAYGYVSWRFFRERINIEELTLLNFFGKQYYDYQQLVGTGLPLIKGYKLKP